MDVKNETVWLLKEIPKEVRFYLSLSKKDQGIDIVIRRLKKKRRDISSPNNKLNIEDYKYIPVQCKFRTKSKTGILRRIKWEELSTYVALCAFTGPWESYIVMTNTTSIRYPHMEKGMKKKDQKYRFVIQNMARTTFQNINREEWMKMVEIYNPRQLTSHSAKKSSTKSPSTPKKKNKNIKQKTNHLDEDDRFSKLWN